jgi:hypothetical protein
MCVCVCVSTVSVLFSSVLCGLHLHYFSYVIFTFSLLVEFSLVMCFAACIVIILVMLYLILIYSDFVHRVRASDL